MTMGDMHEVLFYKSTTIVAGMDYFNVMVGSIEQRNSNPRMEEVHRSSAYELGT